MYQEGIMNKLIEWEELMKKRDIKKNNCKRKQLVRDLIKQNFSRLNHQALLIKRGKNENYLCMLMLISLQQSKICNFWQV